MAAVPLQDPRRFAQVDAGGQPPLYFDPASVTALEPRCDGYALHLAGGQTIELAPAIAAAVLEFLGLRAKGKGKRQKAKGEGEPGLNLSPRPKRPRRNRKSKIENPKSAPRPRGLGAKLIGLFA